MHNFAVINKNILDITQIEKDISDIKNSLIEIEEKIHYDNHMEYFTGTAFVILNKPSDVFRIIEE